jgi:hypothetical protein
VAASLVSLLKSGRFKAPFNLSKRERVKPPQPQPR